MYVRIVQMFYSFKELYLSQLHANVWLTIALITFCTQPNWRFVRKGDKYFVGETSREYI